MKDRDLSIDVAKGIGIILVVAAHARVYFLVNQSVFHMPLFFFISGYLFTPKKTLTFFISKFRSLLLPMYVYVFLYAIIYCLSVHLELYPGVLPNFFYSVLINPFFSAADIPFTCPLWFITCLFLSSTLFHFYYKIFGQKKFFTFILALTIILSLIHIPSGANVITYLSRTFIAFSWICLGYIFRSYENNYSKKFWFTSSFLIFVCSSMLSNNVYFAMIWNDYSSTYISPLFLGLSGTVLTLSISSYLGEIPQRILAGIGYHSYHILANHLFIFFLLGIIISLVLGDRSWFTGIYSRPKIDVRFLYLLLGVFVPYLASQKITGKYCFFDHHN